MMSLQNHERAILHDALRAWRDVLWNRALKQGCRECLELWATVLVRHFNTTREFKEKS